MIVYQATKADFADDVLEDRIEIKIHEFFKKHLDRKRTTDGEIRSWRNSMQYMDKVLSDPDIPDDCGVAIEYQIPQSGKRLDFILTGISEDNIEQAILIELKQWSTATISEKDGIVNTFVGRMGEQTHPSYQAWSYASLLQNFNETVYEEKISLHACAYLHNYIPDEVITNDHYKEYLLKAPVFLKGDAVKLRDFIKKYVKYGDIQKIMYRIEQGKIRPSKMLADSIVAMLKENPEFIMIDDQKVVYETALLLSQRATANKKKVLIVKGGPGTGKSVVAINLMVEMTKRKLLVKYISKNAAPRAVYESKLKGNFRKDVISNLFSGSGAYVKTKPNTFDTLIVDEAHRLAQKAYMYNGEHQVKDLMNAANCLVFFVDEDQRIHLNDAGNIAELKKWATFFDAEVTEMELQSQFRCNGSDGYLAWLDNTLHIKETANTTLNKEDYDFKVFSSPVELRDAIIEKNKINNKSRLVAGYCWPWNSKKNPSLYDLIMPEFDFQMRWNLDKDSSLWIISPHSINEVGCIHTCQGLEVDYVGVIIGADLLYRDGKILTNPVARDKNDGTIKGYKKLIEENEEEGKATVRAIIKNTYRTLMTRGMKGCYVYCVDKELEKYISTKIL